MFPSTVQHREKQRGMRPHRILCKKNKWNKIDTSDMLTAEELSVMKSIQQFMYETFETPERFKEYPENVPQQNPRAITVDAYLYQMVEKKQAMISQIFTSKNINKICDDIDDTALDCRQAKIAAIGDERIKRQMELRDDISNLKMLKNVHLENRYEMEDRITKLPTEIKKAEKIIEGIAADTKTVFDFGHSKIFCVKAKPIRQVTACKGKYILGFPLVGLFPHGGTVCAPQA